MRFLLELRVNYYGLTNLHEKIILNFGLIITDFLWSCKITSFQSNQKKLLNFWYLELMGKIEQHEGKMLMVDDYLLGKYWKWMK